MKTLRFRTVIKKSAAEVLNWHLRESSLQRSLPPWVNISFSQNSCKPNDTHGTIKCLAKIGPFRVRTEYRYKEFIEKEEFSVEQTRGYFKYFQLTSQVRSLETRGCELIETVQYALPFYLQWVDVKGLVRRIFRYKHALIERDLEIFERYPLEKPLKIAVTGSGGFIGTHLVPFLECAGHDVYQLVRDAHCKSERAIYWDPESKAIDIKKLEGFDAIIHLAGDNIADGRWSDAKKKRIRESRVQATDFLVKSLCALASPPKTLLCASAVGYYGDTGSERADEEAAPKHDFFLSQVCKAWEEACLPLKSRAVRVAHMRFGLILGRQGGILKKILPLFQFGLGGRLGTGKQYMSWIAIDDLLGAIYHLLMRSDLEGPFNLCAPAFITNEQFTKELASRLNRWTGPPMPTFLVKWIFGQKADEMLLCSLKVEPKRLINSGYFFRYPTLKQALEHVL